MKKSIGVLSLLLLTTWASAATYSLPSDGSRVVGQAQQAVAKKGDTLNRLAVRHGVGYNEMLRANPRWQGRKIPSGTVVVIPTQHYLPDTNRRGIVINLADMRLYYYPPTQDKVVTFPVAVGKRGWRTPKGRTSVINKRRNPTWTPPASIRKEAARKGRKLKKVYPAGPNNPLGTRALRLGLPGYLIHGTNKPYSIGKRISHGCIRLRRSDIEHLYSLVAVNTPVTIISQASNMRYSVPEQAVTSQSETTQHYTASEHTEPRTPSAAPVAYRSHGEFHPNDTGVIDELDLEQLQQDIDSGAITPIDLSDL